MPKGIQLTIRTETIMNLAMDGQQEESTDGSKITVLPTETDNKAIAGPGIVNCQTAKNVIKSTTTRPK
jgi:hypothetical protein